MQTLAQIIPQHGAMRGAGTVEEMLYTHKNPKLLIVNRAIVIFIISSLIILIHLPYC